MEIVVLPSNTEKAGLKLDNLLDKLNTRIMEKVDECNGILDNMQYLTSNKEKERRADAERLQLCEEAIKKDLRRLRIELAKETDFTYLLDNTEYGCCISIEDNKEYSIYQFYYPNKINFITHVGFNNNPTVTREYSPSVGDIQYYYTSVHNVVQEIIIKYKNEHNKRKSGTGDGKLSENNSAVSE